MFVRPNGPSTITQHSLRSCCSFPFGVSPLNVKITQQSSPAREELNAMSAASVTLLTTSSSSSSSPLKGHYSKSHHVLLPFRHEIKTPQQKNAQKVSLDFLSQKLKITKNFTSRTFPAFRVQSETL